MWTILRRDTRGSAEYGWLSTRHTFSFASWYNPGRMGFGPLRVLNEDRVTPGRGFGAHPHRDMEILSYVLEGALEHKDSMGNGSVIKPGEIQYMSAGTGVVHSEYNASQTDPVHFLQIWIVPNRRQEAPRYGQVTWDDGHATNQLRLVASEEGGTDVLAIRQNVRLWVSKIDEGYDVSYVEPEGRTTFIHVARGTVRLDSDVLTAGDGAMATGLGRTIIEAQCASEVLIFDLPEVA